MAERQSARPISELDRASRARIEHLMGTDPSTVNEDDRAFLNGRRDYLTTEQRADYLAADAEPTEPTDDPVAEKPKARRRKA